ncbi:MAG: lipid A biosynthesis acyltransferase, partial [Pseudomonadota bacterium]
MTKDNRGRPTPPQNRYCPPFRAAYLGPRYWPTWLGFAFLWLMSVTPKRWRIALARRLGAMVMRRNRKRREIV